MGVAIGDIPTSNMARVFKCVVRHLAYLQSSRSRAALSSADREASVAAYSMNTRRAGFVSPKLTESVSAVCTIPSITRMYGGWRFLLIDLSSFIKCSWYLPVSSLHVF